jgi:hypothetical protein
MSQEFKSGGSGGWNGDGDKVPFNKNDMGKVNNGPFVFFNGVPVAQVSSWKVEFVGKSHPLAGGAEFGSAVSITPSLPQAIRKLYAITDSRIEAARKSHANERLERIYSHLSPQHLFPRAVIEVMAITGRSGSVVFMRPVPSLASMLHGEKLPRGVTIRNDRIGDPRDQATGNVVFRPHVIRDEELSAKAEKIYADAGGAGLMLWNWLESVYYERFGPPSEHGVCN